LWIFASYNVLYIGLAMPQEPVAPKPQRIRDPVHGLITFGATDKFEPFIWRLLNTPEFQRLRRIKQLGFSELDVLEDRAIVTPYRVRDYESPDALSQLTIRRPSGTPENVAKVSPVVAALKDLNMYRVYGRSESVMERLNEIWKEAAR
jgi:HD superfamily phosphohydrolase